MNCPVCHEIMQTIAADVLHHVYDEWIFHCPACGTIRITNSSEQAPTDLIPWLVVRVQGVVRSMAANHISRASLAECVFSPEQRKVV